MPEMLSPAILHTSMPSTAGATIRILAFQERPLELIFREVPPRDEARNLQLLEGVYQMGSGFSRRIPPSAHASRRLLTRHLKTCLLVTLFTNTLGIPLSIYVTPADTHDTKGARCLLAGLTFFVPRLKKIWADAAYRGQELAEWCQDEGGWDLEVVERTPGTRGFSIQSRRWVVERTFGWLSRNRRLSLRLRAKSTRLVKPSSR